MSEVQSIVDKINALTVIELVQLSRKLIGAWGIELAKHPEAGVPESIIEQALEEIKTDFDLILITHGEKKVQVIKVVREILPSLGLKEAKEEVENLPVKLLAGVTKEVAQLAYDKLEAVGATVEII